MKTHGVIIQLAAKNEIHGMQDRIAFGRDDAVGRVGYRAVEVRVNHWMGALRAFEWGGLVPHFRGG